MIHSSRSPAHLGGNLLNRGVDVGRRFAKILRMKLSAAIFTSIGLCLSFFLTSTAPAETPAPKVTLSASVDHPNAIYHKGETVTFVLKLESNGKPATEGEISWVITKDGLPLNQSGKAKVENGVAKVQGTLDEPGFLQIQANYRPDAKAAPISAMAGAGIDPTEIARSMPAPSDFDAYWTAEKEKLAAVPGNPRLTPVKSTSDQVDSFDVQVNSVGAPVSGYFARPKGAAEKALPIILTVHGAGVRSSNLGSAVGWANRGFLAMDVNAHGLPNGKPEDFYKKLADGDLKDYRTRGSQSRETIYFHDMFLRLVRSIDFLTAQPEWDGKNVVVYGSSQGGFQAIVAAALDPRVTFFAAGVPAGCDHSAQLLGRIAGWPKFAGANHSEQPDPEILKAASYYDTMNFAARSHAKGCIFTTGFIDRTCPPSSVYATYNQITIPKEIYNDIPSGHQNSPEATSAMVQAVLRAVGK